MVAWEAVVLREEGHPCRPVLYILSHLVSHTKELGTPFELQITAGDSGLFFGEVVEEDLLELGKVALLLLILQDFVGAHILTAILETTLPDTTVGSPPYEKDEI